jgi:hypothetical protein
MVKSKRRARAASPSAPSPSQPEAPPPDRTLASIPRQLLKGLCSSVEALTGMYWRARAPAPRGEDCAAANDGLNVMMRLVRVELVEAAAQMQLVLLDTTEKAAVDAALRVIEGCCSLLDPLSPGTTVEEIDGLLAMLGEVGRGLQDAVETVRGNATMELLQHPEPAPWRPDPPAARDEIISLGKLDDGRYGIGDADPVTVTDIEDSVLQAFLSAPSMSAPQLVTKISDDRAPRVLGRLRKKYGGIFAPAIRCPGKKGQGGYSVRIRRFE